MEQSRSQSQSQQQCGAPPLSQWSAVADDTTAAIPTSSTLLLYQTKRETDEINNTASIALSGQKSADKGVIVEEPDAVGFSFSSSRPQQQVLWSDRWSIRPSSIIPITTTTTTTNKIPRKNSRSPNSKSILVLEQVESAAVCIPSIECGKQSPGVSSLRGQKIPMCNFVTKYRRRVETYAAQNARDIGFLSPTVGPYVRTEEFHNINNSGGPFRPSLADSMPLHIKCAPQCEEESMMRQRESQSLRISTNTTQNVTHRNSGDTSSDVDELISTIMKWQTNSECSNIRPVYSTLSPVRVLDTSGVCDQSVKRPISLRRVCFDTTSDSSESSILSE